MDLGQTAYAVCKRRCRLEVDEHRSKARGHMMNMREKKLNEKEEKVAWDSEMRAIKEHNMRNRDICQQVHMVDINRDMELGNAEYVSHAQVIILIF